MSLQRIFESARRLGLPVIVTDPAGREPMVVLPLEQFEAMAGAGEMRESTPSEAVRSSKMVTEPELSTIPPISPNLEFEASAPVQPTSSNSEISLEEGFYLDPIDEQGTI